MMISFRVFTSTFGVLYGCFMLLLNSSQMFVVLQKPSIDAVNP